MTRRKRAMGVLDGSSKVGSAKVYPNEAALLKAQTTKEKGMWVITHPRFGAYSFAHGSRKDAIKAHTKDLGRSWDECKRQGHRAVKAKVTYPFQKK